MLAKQLTATFVSLQLGRWRVWNVWKGLEVGGSAGVAGALAAKTKRLSAVKRAEKRANGDLTLTRLPFRWPSSPSLSLTATFVPLQLGRWRV